MQSSLKRLSIVAFICFFPLAIAGMLQVKTNPRKAIKYYYISILIFLVFWCFMALYTYGRGGNFIKPIGSFY